MPTLEPRWGAVLESRRIDRQRCELWLLSSAAGVYGHEGLPSGAQGSMTLLKFLAHRGLAKAAGVCGGSSVCKSAPVDKMDLTVR